MPKYDTDLMAGGEVVVRHSWKKYDVCVFDDAKEGWFTLVKRWNGRADVPSCNGKINERYLQGFKWCR